MGKNHRKKEFKHRREIVIWVYGYTCLQCGDKPSKLDVHHDNRFSDDNRWDNLVPLCKPCHRAIHLTDKRFNLTKFRDADVL